MPRRVSLPGASELFRSTPPSSPATASPLTDSSGTDSPSPVPAPSTEPASHTGRVRHDEKMTVYVSATELVALEQARLGLRAEHGLKVDRGRLVRAAVALALADLAERGADSNLVQQLREQ